MMLQTQGAEHWCWRMVAYYKIEQMQSKSWHHKGEMLQGEDDRESQAAHARIYKMTKKQRHKDV
jgi:hypothetical protein